MTSPEIIAAINSALFLNTRPEAEIAKAAGIGSNTIRHFRNTGNINLKTLLRVCGEIGIEIVVKGKDEKHT